MAVLFERFRSMVLPFVFLSIAIGFSVRGCLPAFAAYPEMAPRKITLTMLATAICISALALAFSGRGVLLGGATLASGLAVASVARTILGPATMVAIAATCLVIYLYLSPAQII
ncbi:hypothetical protein RGR602_PC00733 (plasmid) [Rhizobium gallicum bv. gallicum R602sp]|uniref:Uncharacterized protein n=1 Tax=Rhizobium gallicum bv. gallicum R602sp TaxID=1041138 RepID=A0A0B4XDA4_9HYPH|nr:hypothetical protein RGR602_PC00733 [Rhizobium gallicum bv. gallicum R602sp]